MREYIRISSIIRPLLAAGISEDDALALRRIAMTLHRWHELECGDGNDYGSWAIERIAVTRRVIAKTSSPACSPQYIMTVPQHTECERKDSGWVVADIAKVKGGNTHDLEHYYVWIDESDIVELPFLVHHHYQHGHGKDYITRTLIADREMGACKRLSKIMAKYPGFASYVQGDPRGAALYILRPGDVPEGADVNTYYSRGIAVYK